MFSQENAEYVKTFVQSLKHTKDPFYGKPFELLDWQVEALDNVYGTLKEDGNRQYKYAYLEIPKKNGKSEIVAALALYHLCADGVMGGEIYGCAAEKVQAGIVFDVSVAMREQCPAIKKRTKVIESKKTIIDIPTGSFYRVVSAEAYSKHGLNPSMVIFDELHAQPNRALWDVMTFGASTTRAEPLTWVITTAGDDPDRKSIGWEIHSKADEIIKGIKSDPRWYCKIYGLPLEADWMDEDNWRIANPSLGKTFTLEALREEAISASQNPKEERLFRWLRLNQWLKNKSNAWLPLTAWDNTEDEYAPDDLRGLECYGGLDLATTWDLNGFCLLFPPQKGCQYWRVLFEGWIPEDNMKERVKSDGVPYDDWVRQGFLHTTPGNVTDYAYIRDRIIQLSKIYKIKEIGYDQHNATQCALEILSKGIKMIPVAQTIMGMSSACKQLEVLFKSGGIKHNVNPLARWCYGNVNISMDGKENYMPIKNSRTDRIDLFVAMVDAMCRALPNVTAKSSVYKERGVIVV